MPHVTIIAVPRALGSTITIPLEMLGAANDIARAGRQAELCRIVEVVSAGQKKVVLAGGLQIHCRRTLDQVAETDLIFVPGLWGNPRAAVARNPELCRWLSARHREGTTICAIASGTHFLAAAGLLDGHQATTHWRYFEAFESQFPRVKLQRRRFITQANDIYCTGSVNAARDIMLHFIALLYDEDISNLVAQHFTHELKRSYESLLLSKDQKSTHHDETIIKVQEWLQENFTTPIRLVDIAERFQLSVRSLNRRFRSAANTTPLQYLQEVRINHAKELLKQSNLAITEVADRVGYQDTSYFASLFKKLNAVSPNEYRRLVRNKLFAAESDHHRQ